MSDPHQTLGSGSSFEETQQVPASQPSFAPENVQSHPHPNPSQTHAPQTHGARPAVQQNPLALGALLVAIIGTILSFVNGFAGYGWLLQLAALILGVISLFLKGKSRTIGIVAVILSILGLVVSLFVWVTYINNLVEEANFRSQQISSVTTLVA